MTQKIQEHGHKIRLKYIIRLRYKKLFRQSSCNKAIGTTSDFQHHTGVTEEMSLLQNALFQSEKIPLTEDQLDDIVDRLDTDGDGEVDLG